MALEVAFDHGGRTYTVQSPSIVIWNVHIIAQLNGKMTLETDIKTGDKLFVTWSQVGVIRLVSSVNDKGHALN